MRNPLFCVSCLVALASTALATPAASAATLGFDAITSNDPAAVAVGESQFSLQIVPDDTGIRLSIFNSGPVDATIASIYLDDDASIFAHSGWTILDGDGVHFRSGGSPENLPAGNEIDFTADFTFTAVNPKPQNGVNPDESVAFHFDLASGVGFPDVQQALASGDLRIGLHAISFNVGGDPSESFVNVIPEPGGLAVLGLAGLALLRRRRIEV